MAKYMTQIARDPFARASLMRRKADTDCGCKWCGQDGKWEYGWISDSRPDSETAFSSPFCSIGCYRAYYK